MQTEELQLQRRRRDPHALSRALQPLTPLSCELVTSRGKPVSLSSAGYVLRFGHSYRLRVLLPLAEHDVHELKLINVPQFLEQAKAIREVTDAGEVWSIPFKVHPDLLSGLARLGLDIRYDDLELTVYTPPSSPRENIQYSCPIVVSHRWLFISLLVTLGILWTIGQQTITAFLDPNPGLGHSVAEVVVAVVTRPATWWAVIGLALLGIVLSAIVRLVTIWWRCRDLRNCFREAYPSIEAPT